MESFKKKASKRTKMAQSLLANAVREAFRAPNGHKTLRSKVLGWVQGHEDVFLAGSRLQLVDPIGHDSGRPREI